MSAQDAAFEPFANATLTVELAVAPTSPEAAAGWVISPNGNLIPSPVDVGPVPSPVYERSYRCHLHQIRNPQVEDSAGVNSTTFFLEGMLLNPWKFDDEVFPNQVFQATYNGLIGEFELFPEQHVLPEARSTLGTRISGTFRLAGAGQTR